MADKEVPLSIVLRTVDKATAGVQAFNKRLEAQLKPIKDFKKAFGELKENLDEKYGFSRVVDGFKGVGGAISDVIGKVALVGGAIGVAVAGVLSLIDHFDNLGDTAERLGTSADFLAAFRYAAERAGAPLEAVDTSLQTLVTNIGAAKAGTGKLLKFLNQISPVLARQVTSAHSLEEALGLLADAAAKLPDAARRSKLAAAALGDAALAPLLARGSKGIQELLTRYYELAGAQGEAAEAAGKTDDALKDLHASTDGVKAALVTGLAPALTEIIGKMTEWLVAHREDVAKWAEDIGKKLPSAVDSVVTAVSGAVRDVAGFVDAIGGWKVAAGALAVVMAGPLIEAVVALGAALLTTPVGVVITGLAAIAAGIASITSETKDFKAFVDKEANAGPTVAVHGGIPYTATQEAEYQARIREEHANARRTAIASFTGQSLDDVSRLENTTSTESFERLAERARLAASGVKPADLPPEIVSRFVPPGETVAVGPPQELKIKVDFTNAPKGLRATVDPQFKGDVDLSVGHQMSPGGS